MLCVECSLGPREAHSRAPAGAPVAQRDPPQGGPLPSTPQLSVSAATKSLCKPPTHTYAHTHKHTCAHTHAHTCTRTGTHTHTYMHTHLYTYARTHMHVYVRTHAHAHTKSKVGFPGRPDPRPTRPALAAAACGCPTPHPPCSPTPRGSPCSGGVELGASRDTEVPVSLRGARQGWASASPLRRLFISVCWARY